jgi:AcrR family transcriptional regulator
VAAAIETIAELGFGQASLARIAERAGTSKGVITYHFAGKDDLMKEILKSALDESEAFMRPKILAESSGPAMLRAYIEANLAFMREHRNHMVAIFEIFVNARREDGSRLFDGSTLDSATMALAQLLARLQSAGEFRQDFDPYVAAVAIRGAIDAVPPQMARDPELDIDHYGGELAALFDLAPRTGVFPQIHPQ